MVKIKSDGAYTVVRKVRKGGGARGTMHKDNLDEALTRGSGNVILMNQTTGIASKNSKQK
ncbi:MAG: hypothetical protein DBY32_04185 [Phascolarctobacterium sp.]|nr:MAG: hypothetical protein DBY32_04185 [Phascolarctobacterium sp.]